MFLSINGYKIYTALFVVEGNNKVERLDDCFRVIDKYPLVPGKLHSKEPFS